MAGDKKEEIKNIGVVYFIRSRKASRISIRITREKEVRVSVPVYASLDNARAFVISKQDWIIKTLNKVDKKFQDSIIVPDKGLKTHFHTFVFNKKAIEKVLVKIESGIVKIDYPEELSHEDQKLQDAFRYTYIEILRKEAKYYLPPRLSELADKYGFKYKDLRIKNIKSRWGSCSGKSNINLSLHVMKLPKHLIDFIILHELCHTIHMNHGPRFHKLLEKVCPDAAKNEKEIKKYGIFKE